jgi:hypothetical protein
MHPMRTPLKTEFGFSAAEAMRGSVKPVAAASVVPRKWRRESECVVMRSWNAKARRLLPESQGNQRSGGESFAGDNDSSNMSSISWNYAHGISQVLGIVMESGSFDIAPDSEVSLTHAPSKAIFQQSPPTWDLGVYTRP